MQNPNKIGIFTLNTICNYDPDIIPLLDAPFGTAFIRCKDGSFQKKPLVIPPDA